MAEDSIVHRFVLGAAALAEPYGIANPQSSLSPTETDDVLNAAWSLGIRFIDTAPAYGDVELRIGNWSERTGNRFRTISKLPKMQNIPNAEVTSKVHTFLETTCRNLRLDRVEGYLLHDPKDFAHSHVREALKELQAAEKLGYSGLSVYSPEEAITALATGDVCAFQVPVNVFDNRLADSGLSEKCVENDIRLFLRSVYLQGLIFRNPETLPSYFQPILPKLHAFKKLSLEAQVSPSHLALAYVLKTARTGQIIVGCRQASHIEDLSSVIEGEVVDREIFDRLNALRDSLEVKMIDPRYWPHSS